MAEAALITAIAGGLSAGATAYSASQSKKANKPTAAPQPREVVPMPDPEDPRVKAEKERQRMLRRQAGGRESTDMVGMDAAYSGSVLGE